MTLAVLGSGLEGLFPAPKLRYFAAFRLIDPARIKLIGDAVVIPVGGRSAHDDTAYLCAPCVDRCRLRFTERKNCDAVVCPEHARAP